MRRGCRRRSEELGGLWIKLGQALALRFDILPADYCLQFFQLLNRIEPFSVEESARTILERELHRPVEPVFPVFEWRPYAAASIGQVHRAELPGWDTRRGQDSAAGDSSARSRRPGLLMRIVAALIDAVPVIGQLQRARARCRSSPGGPRRNWIIGSKRSMRPFFRRNAGG